MIENKTKIYITTPIYYVNDKPHIGHFYCNLLADAFARFHKAIGKQVVVLTGTDEHGQKIQRAAEKNNINPQVFCDEYSNYFKQMSIDFGFLFAENDFNNGKNFIRTTDHKHKAFVQNVWRILNDNGWIYKGKYSGWYAVRDEAFYQESELVEKNGKKVAPSGAEVEWKEEESYFFKLSVFTDILLKIYKENNNIIIPHQKTAEITSFLEGNGNHIKIEDLSISRLKKKTSDGSEFYWGINVPNDNRHIIYVWLDALFNYMSANQDIWLENQQNSNWQICHFMAKDIIRFHAIYWPSFLIALNYKLEDITNNTTNIKLFKNCIFNNIYCSGWWTNEGEKISKSLGNIVNPYEEIDWLMSTFSIEQEIAIDYLKYFCLTNIAFGNDANYSRNQLVEMVNAQLANNIGNLGQRVLTFLNKNFRNEIDLMQQALVVTQAERDILFNYQDLSVYDFIKNQNCSIETCNFLAISQAINSVCNKCNQYLETNEPWKKYKTNQKDEALKCLLLVLEVWVNCVIVIAPLIPTISTKLLANCGIESAPIFDYHHLIPANIKNEIILICKRLDT